MKILVLDDEKYRHEGFDKRFASHDVFHAYDCARAERWLDEHVFDLACLDHDLGFAASETGQDCARYIAAMPAERRPREVLIHSWNMAGARSMAAILSGHVARMRVSPFQWPDDHDPEHSP